MITTKVQLTSIVSYLYNKKKRKTKRKKNVSSVMRTLSIYSLNILPIHHTAGLTITSYCTFRPYYLTYLITVSLYLLTIFLQFLLLPSSASGNDKSDLFFYEFGGFFKICLYLDSTYK